jgi:dienelactone hydrolase
MDSTLSRFPAISVTLRRAAVLLAAAACLPAAALNHDRVVNPLPPGPFNVACSNIAQDTGIVARLGGKPSDFWEGQPVNEQAHYIDQILSYPGTALRFDVPVPDVRSLYVGHAGENVSFVGIVCHPTPRTNNDPAYTLPETGALVPHMQPPGALPQLISNGEYASTLGIQLSPAAPAGPARMPLIVYSHGLSGSPISAGYLDVMVGLAAHGYMVSAIFHGDPRFSRVRVNDLNDAFYLLTQFDRVAEMMLMRPLSLKVMTDVLLASGYAPAVDTDRIGGFGASLGGQAMANLLGARQTTNIDLSCHATARDDRIKAAVGFVPYSGQSFLPSFCNDQAGAADVNRPYLALAGTADTTAPIKLTEQAVNLFGSSRYLVQLPGGKHELRPEDTDDLLTWMITFLNAYLDVRWDPGAMARFITMNNVVGGRDESMLVDVHVPFAPAGGETRAFEFLNTDLNHYFVAAGGDEIASILSGGAGRGWVLTGESFKVWPAMPSDASLSASAACRFYGVPAGGPNSHFFTANASECDFVKRHGGWFYEGIGFYIREVLADGSCPDGYLEVNRAYNLGSPRNDSNHRFSTSDSTMREMARKGWGVEGTVMCARP